MLTLIYFGSKPPKRKMELLEWKNLSIATSKKGFSDSKVSPYFPKNEENWN
jgi:hypothetical protein